MAHETTNVTIIFDDKESHLTIGYGSIDFVSQWLKNAYSRLPEELLAVYHKGTFRRIIERIKTTELDGDKYDYDSQDITVRLNFMRNNGVDDFRIINIVFDIPKKSKTPNDSGSTPNNPPPSGGGSNTPPPSGGGNNNPPPSGGGNNTPPPSGGGSNTPPPSGGGNNNPPPSGGGSNTPPPSGGGSNTPPPSGSLYYRSFQFVLYNPTIFGIISQFTFFPFIQGESDGDRLGIRRTDGSIDGRSSS